MTVTDEEELYPVAALEIGRDLPLTFQYRTERIVIAALGLPDARSPREEDARNAVLTEAKLAYERNKWVSFSRRPASYTNRNRYCGDSFRHGPVLSAVADGADAGWLEEDRARPGSRGRQSRFRATTALYERLREHPIRTCLHEPIWLRDDDRRLLDYRETGLTRRMRKEVEAINAEMAHIRVEFPGVEKEGSYWLAGDRHILPGLPAVLRVFNRGSFKKGGRLYGWWQGLRAAERAQLLLNGQEVLEPDYRQLHAAIIYAQREIRLPGDAYETAEFSRAFGKMAFNIVINARSHRSAVWAVAKELGVDRQTASKLLTAIIAKHKAISDIFCSDAGVSLMKIDADITLCAVQLCQGNGIAVLPVHDSLIVPEANAEEAAEIMREAFAARFPQARGCEVRVKKNEIPHMKNVFHITGEGDGDEGLEMVGMIGTTLGRTAWRSPSDAGGMNYEPISDAEDGERA
jgi:hypothetical protein